ncbi:hypothetical protein [Streptomyces europaeiscabiei]|uniref:hypothetical protein n=1 Tax=Streptomyces europaeiscabiei TaxID=146819 RepID=UPI0038F7924C
MTVLTASYQVTTPAFTNTPVAGWTLAIDATLAGLLLAVACGPAWWHQPPPDSRAPWWHRAGAYLTVPLAVPIGLYIGVNRTGATSGGPYGTWWVLVTLPLTTAGATAICVSLSRPWWRGEGVGGWMVPMLATTTLYGLAFWIGTASSVYVWLSTPSEYLILATRAAWTGPLAVAAVLGCVFAWRLAGDHGVADPTADRPALRRRRGRSDLHSTPANGIAHRGGREGRGPTARHVVSGRSRPGRALAILIARADVVPDVLRAAPLATTLTFVASCIRWATVWTDPLETARRFLVTPLAVLAVSVLLLAASVPLLPSRTRPLHRTVLYLLPPLSAGIAAALTTLLINYAGLMDYHVLLAFG